MNYIAIMAGGIGSRFWPSSTREHPKQFLDILGCGKSLIRLTYERIISLIPDERILVVTNERYKNLVQKELPEIPIGNILCEPSRNNTAPSVALTALHLMARDPQACFAMLPSDHVVMKEAKFLKLLEMAFDKANMGGSIITLGIQPTRPDTGYGYIETQKSTSYDDFLTVQTFREKPNPETARQYLNAGNYLWNAGMFVWKCETILEAFREYAPDVLSVLESDRELFGTDQEEEYIKRVYPKTASISVDYAILEKYPNILTLPADIAWSDLGTWNSLYSHSEKNNDKNVLLGDKIKCISSQELLVRNETNKRIVIKGLKNYIVVDNAEALLIYPKNEEQEIKKVVQSLDD